MGKDGLLGSFEELVLLAVARGGEDAYGMTVRREIEERTGRDVAIGAVYATLDRLEAKGLLASEFRDGDASRRGRARRFFELLSERFRHRLCFAVARQDGEIVGGTTNVAKGEVLYGRYWGCQSEFDCLHFEACYYQGIDYCIDEGLELFEPGTQGEHKVSRGFAPQSTWSAHWLAQPEFFAAIGEYLETFGDRLPEALREEQRRIKTELDAVDWPK